MNDCPWLTRISAYHDGELPAAARREVEDHLLSCAPCRDALAHCRTLSAALAELPRPALSALSRERTHEVLRRVPEPGVIRLAARLGGIAAVLLLAATLALWQSADAAAAGSGATAWETAALSPVSDARSGGVAPETQMARWMVDVLESNGP